MARKTKYTAETVAMIVEAIKLGATYELAAGYAGIGERTLYDWLEQYPQFSQAIKDAEGAGAFVWLTKIQQAANDGDWHAAAWKLERRYPKMYGRQVQEHTGEVKQTHEHSGTIGIQFFDANAALTALTGGPDADR